MQRILEGTVNALATMAESRDPYTALSGPTRKLVTIIVKEIEFPWPVARIILQHHERLDGSGYPVGLKGDEILLEAKILADADVVKAMSSHRPYRPALGIEAVLSEIAAKRGILYEPAVVDICLRLFTEKGFCLT